MNVFLLVSLKASNFARQTQFYFVNMVKNIIFVTRFFVAAVIMFFSFLAPVAVMAQLDQKHSDANDGLAVPFEITVVENGKFAEDTHWYTIKVGTGKLWHTMEDSDQLYCSSVQTANPGDEYLWCFTGDNVCGFRIYNKAKGANYIAYVPANVTREPLVMKHLGTTMAPRTFKLYQNGNGYNFYYPQHVNSCINDHKGNGVLKLWISSAAPNDGGCRMTFTLAQGDTDIPSSEGLPFKPTKKLANDSLASNTHWYTMTIRGKKNIYAENGKINCKQTEKVTEQQLWAFVGNATEGFEIYNYATGTTHRAYTPTPANENPLTMESKSATRGYKWMLIENSHGGHSFHFPGYETSCWNDFNNENWIGIWRNASAIKDSGSNIVFTEQNINNIGELVSVTAINLDKTSLSLFPGESTRLGYTVEPINATNTSVLFFSQDENVCTVDESTGVITAVAPGETNIGVSSLDGSACYASCRVHVKDGSSLLPVEGTVMYVYRADGGVDAFPDNYLSGVEETGGKLRITAKDGTVYSYGQSDYEQVSETAPEGLAKITSFKFNDKFNSDIIADAQGTIINDSLIQLTVAGIGKWLTPSFQTDGDADTKVYVGDKEQTSKVSRNSFRHEVIYTASRENFKMLRSTADGRYSMLPFGRDYRVQVQFLADSPNGEYNVPAIYITTDDGRPVSTKSTYKGGTITIDGAGVFPDMPKTVMQIKGRGNSSWSSDPEAKNPYHFKFSSKQSVLGLTKGKHWNLLANRQNMSLMTNAIGMKVARLVGTQAANDMIPVELYVNGEYRGSYNLTEKVGFGNNSLDVSDTLANAVLLELDTYYDEKNKFTTATTYYSLPVNIKEPEDFNQDYINFTVRDIQSRINTGFLSDLKRANGIEKQAHVQSMATFLMTNELVANYELMHPKSTYYFCRDIMNPDSLIHFGPVWDLDWGYGYEYNRGTYFDMDPKEDYWTRASSMEAWQYLRDLRYRSGEAFEREYFRVWTDFAQNHLQELLDFCDDYQEYAQPSFTHNSEIWGQSDNYKGQMEKAKKWLTQRVNHIYNYLANTLGYAEKYPDVVADPTPIVDVKEDDEPVRVLDQHIYTLDGRMVNAKGRLPRGIYIIQGRKVVVQ